MWRVYASGQRGLQQRLVGRDRHDVFLAIESQAKILDQAIRGQLRAQVVPITLS